jgi:Flp pilus assembly pilin Flp
MSDALTGCRLCRTENGASSVEYAILVSLIAIVIIGAVMFFSEGTTGLFEKSCASIVSARGNGTC